MAASSKDQKQEVKKACQEVRAAFNDPISQPPDKKQGESLDFSMLGYAARRTNRILHALCQRGNNLGCHVLAACDFVWLCQCLARSAEKKRCLRATGAAS